jgi:uracil permease
MTRVGSRYPVTFCGIFLCLLAFFHKVLVFLMSIPPSVVGAALLAAMASQVGAGVSILTRLGKGMDSRDYLVVGLPILLGGVITLLPETFFQTLSPGLQAFLKNGLAVGIVSVLFLEHVFLRKGKSNRKGNE